MIDSVAANVAVASAIIATDGAQINTDGEEGAAGGALAGFGEILQKMSEAMGEQPAITGAVEVVDAPKLPHVNPVLKVEVQPEMDELPVPEQVAVELSQVAVEIANDLPAEEEDVEIEPRREEKKAEPIEDHCDGAMVMPAPVQTSPQPVENQPMEEEVLPKVSDSNGKKKVELPERPKMKEAASENVQLKKAEPQKLAEQAVQQVEEEVPVDVVESAKNDQPKREQAQKIEFVMPQAEVKHKEIAPPPVVPEQNFIDANHPKIVSEIQGRLLPDGGTMHIRLDPPELGALSVQIDVRDGVVAATFATSNDEATRLLSHSLGQLRQTLESAGVSVDKLQVQQAPREHFSGGPNSNSREQDRSSGQQAYERSARDDQQRREMLQRMWKRLTVGRDMLDLVA